VSSSLPVERRLYAPSDPVIRLLRHGDRDQPAGV